MPSLLDFFDTCRPSSKRQKISHNAGPQSSPGPAKRPCLKESTRTHSPTATLARGETDSADPVSLSVGNEESSNLQSSQTELEVSLPPIGIDSKAIEEYEASKAAEIDDDRNLSLEERFGERKWDKGKSSIYVDAFNLALETVLNEEAHLFDPQELHVFSKWKELSYAAQYLSVNSR